MRPSSCNRGEGGMEWGGQLEIMMEEGEEKDWSLLLDSIKIGGGLLVLIAGAGALVTATQGVWVLIACLAAAVAHLASLSVLD